MRKMYNIWELKEAERQMDDNFTELLRKHFGDDALSCLHLHFETPQVSIQSKEETPWFDFSLEQNGQIICVNGTTHPRHAEMIAVIKEFFYKGENNGKNTD